MTLDLCSLISKYNTFYNRKFSNDFNELKMHVLVDT